jgi:predicted amidophosphoribosyltransferase
VPLFDIFEPPQKTNRKSQKSQDLAERAECRFQLRVDRQTVQDLLASSPGPIVFVDDVITSGATAMAAYMALEDPSRFEVWTLANRPKLARQTGI